VKQNEQPNNHTISHLNADLHVVLQTLWPNDQRRACHISYVFDTNDVEIKLSVITCIEGQ
jgi:hypothetical protein